MAFNVFEAAISSEQEVGIARQASVDKFAAAVYDVRERLGGALFAAHSLDEFRDRVAMMKNDQSLYKIIGAHLTPITGVVRRIVGKNSVLEREFRAALDLRIEREAALRATGLFKGACYPGCEKNEAHSKKWHKNKKEKESSRYADFSGTQDLDQTFHPSEGELIPADNFDGYLNSVDQGAEGKVDRNFTAECDSMISDCAPSSGALDGVLFPGSASGQENDSFQGAGPKKASMAFTLYRDWCESTGHSPLRLSSLDAYADKLSDGDYFRLARTIQAWENEHHPTTPTGQSKSKLKDVTAGQHDVDPNEPWRNTMADEPYFSLQETPDFADLALDGDYQGEHQRGVAPGIVPPEDWPVERHMEYIRTHGGQPEDVQAERKRQGVGSRNDPMRAYTAWCAANNLKKISARNVAHFAGNDAQLCYHLALRMKKAIHTARLRQAAEHRVEDFRGPLSLGDDPGIARNPYTGDTETGRFTGNPEGHGHWDQGDRTNFADISDAVPESDEPPLERGPDGSLHYQARRRTAAPDYLQKADDALTQLLNQKAEEFQATIAPLQQALTTVQQAEQLQQQANPMNVLPPPGTVNVMPGQAPPGQVGMPDPSGGTDPSAAAAAALAGPPGGAAPPPGDAGLGFAPGGGTPDDAAGPPPAAAGLEGALPPELQQALMQQAARRNLKKDRPRQAGARTAASVFDLWQKWQNNQGSGTQRGGEVDYENFAQQYGVGQEALSKLKKRHQYQGSVTRYLSWCERHGLRAGHKRNLDWYGRNVTTTERQRLARALRAEVPNIAEEAAQSQWRKMDSSLTAHGYKYDKSAGHWTKPGARPVKNHWPIAATRHYAEDDDGMNWANPLTWPGAWGRNIEKGFGNLVSPPSRPARTDWDTPGWNGYGSPPAAPPEEDSGTPKDPTGGLLQGPIDTPGISGPPPAPKPFDSPFAGGGFDPQKIPGVTGGPNTPEPPTGAGAAAPSGAGAGGDYTVQEGDTLSGIAQSHGIGDYNDIIKANPGDIGSSGTNISTNENLIHPGDVLHGVGGGGVTPPAPATAPETPAAPAAAGGGAGGAGGGASAEDTHPGLMSPVTPPVDSAHSPANTNPGLTNPPAPKEGRWERMSAWLDARQAGQHSKPDTHTVHLDDVEYASYDPEEKYSGGRHENYSGPHSNTGENPDGQIVGRRKVAATIGDIAREYGVDPQTLREYTDMGNYSIDGPMSAPWQEKQVREMAQGLSPKKFPGDPSSAEAGLSIARRKQAWSGWGPAQFPKTRQVTGWNWDNRLSAYVSSSPQRFACSCGESWSTPSGFHRCGCGRQFNSYCIGQGGDRHEASVDKFLVREIPTRPGVIVASIYKLTEPGELDDDGDDDGRPTMSKPPKDWARRDRNQRWTPSAIG